MLGKIQADRLNEALVEIERLTKDEALANLDEST